MAYILPQTRACPGRRRGSLGCVGCAGKCPCKTAAQLSGLGFSWGGLFSGITNAAASVAGSSTGKTSTIATVVNKIAAPIAQTALAVQAAGQGNQQVQLQHQAQQAPPAPAQSFLTSTIGGVPTWTLAAGGVAALALVIAVAKR